MYSLLLAAALAVAPRPSYPASALPPARTITGRVADSTGTALPDVRVRVLELGRGTTTDAEGRFALTQLPSGTYEVAFSRIGYAPVVQRVTVASEDIALDVAMRPSTVELPEVQVTASPNATTALTSPQPTSSWPATIFASPKPPRSARLSTDSPVSTASMKARPSGSRLSGASARAACSCSTTASESRHRAGATSTRRISRPPTRSGSR